MTKKCLNLYGNILLLKVLNLKSQILNVFWNTLVFRNTVVEIQLRHLYATLRSEAIVIVSVSLVNDTKQQDICVRIQSQNY